MEIREARAEELDAAAAVMVSAYEQYREALTPGLWEGYKRDIADVRGRLPESQLVVAVEGSMIVGAVTYYPPRSPGSGEERRLPEEQTGEGWPPAWAGVRLLAVSPRGRGQGYGRALMEECLRRARAAGAPTLGLHTTEMMALARGMYERMGFVRVPEYDFHPAPGVVVMAYALSL